MLMDVSGRRRPVARVLYNESLSSEKFRTQHTVVVVVDVVDLRPAVDADDLDDGLMVRRSQVEREGGVGVVAGRPGRRRRARRDVRHVERTRERLDRALSRRHRDAEQREHAVRHRGTYCNGHVVHRKAKEIKNK